MSTTTITPAASTRHTTCSTAGRVTRSLLGYGVIAGPCYVTVSLAQAFTRDGFDPTRHAWSLLANGQYGWIHVTNLIVSGLMTVAAAAGIRRALRTGRASTWAPILIALYGLGMVLAGIFRADPAQGFPAGAPETTTVSWHGMIHFGAGGVGFLALIVACFLLAARFARERARGLAIFSRVAGVAFLSGFAGIASGSHGPTTLGFVAAIMIVWVWLSTVSVHFYKATD